MFILTSLSIYGQINYDKWDSLTEKSFQHSVELVKNHQRFYAIGANKTCCYTNGERMDFIKFIDSVKIIKKSWKEYFIIETILNGETVVIQNYIIHKKSKNYFEVILVERSGERWTIAKKSKINLSKEFTQYFERVPLFEGINVKEVILSKFTNDKVESSEYFIIGTIKQPLPFIRVFAKYIYSEKEKKFILDPLQEKKVMYW